MQRLPKEPDGGATDDRREEEPCREKPRRSYYYDDAYGYEDFDPEDGEEPEADEGECSDSGGN